MNDSLEELRRELEGLRASSARLVMAADAERRRIERELHDGAQQHLVALAVNVQLASQLLESDPAGVSALLDEIGLDVRDALESVRGLASSIYPPLLLDRGLAEALRSAAAATGLSTRVETPALGRYPAEVEATVYFCCVEALRSASSREGAGGRATIRAWPEQGSLCFEVDVDGGVVGPAAEDLDAGPSELSDRVAALGGRLTSGPGPGRRTRVAGEIPLPR
jgi:signal transduction histidine kinase